MSFVRFLITGRQVIWLSSLIWQKPMNTWNENSLSIACEEWVCSRLVFFGFEVCTGGFFLLFFWLIVAPRICAVTRSRGLRNGDPLSPHLFSYNVLRCCLRWLVWANENKWRPHKLVRDLRGTDFGRSPKQILRKNILVKLRWKNYYYKLWSKIHCLTTRWVNL